MTEPVKKIDAPQKIWDQYPDETSKAYDRFTRYLNLGADRSLEKLREKLGKSTGYTRQLEKWSVFHNWVERAREYDRYLIQKSLEDQEEIARKGRAILLSAVEDAAKTVLSIMKTSKQSLAANEVSQMNLQLKATLEVLNRAGVTAPDPDSGSHKWADVVNNYYQQIYNDHK